MHFQLYIDSFFKESVKIRIRVGPQKIIFLIVYLFCSLMHTYKCLLLSIVCPIDTIARTPKCYKYLPVA